VVEHLNFTKIFKLAATDQIKSSSYIRLVGTLLQSDSVDWPWTTGTCSHIITL